MVYQNLLNFLWSYPHDFHISDWCTVIVVTCLFGLLELKQPFHQMFSLDDRLLQHPFTVHERVPTLLMLVIDVGIPSISIFIGSLFTGEIGQKLHLLHVSILGFASSFVFTGFLTNFLKICIGRPRPDFLARCVPYENTPVHELVTSAVCSTKNLSRLNEGFKSAPSGHSSLSFAVFFYLALWICGQLKTFAQGNTYKHYSYKLFIALIPLLISGFIAISRTEDYRHHPTDVLSGTILGVFVGYVSYRAFFPSLLSTYPNLPYSASQPSYRNSNSFDSSSLSDYDVTLEA